MSIQYSISSGFSTGAMTFPAIASLFYSTRPVFPSMQRAPRPIRKQACRCCSRGRNPVWRVIMSPQLGEAGDGFFLPVAAQHFWHCGCQSVRRMFPAQFHPYPNHVVPSATDLGSYTFRFLVANKNSPYCSEELLGFRECIGGIHQLTLDFLTNQPVASRSVIQRHRIPLFKLL